MNLADKVTRFLRDNPEKKFTARAIAGWIFETYPDECRKKQERSTAKLNPLDSEEKLLNQLISEIGALRRNIQKKCTGIKNTEDRPRKYYFSESDEKNHQLEDGVSEHPQITEIDLYPILYQFLKSEFMIYSRRIDEKPSSNKRGRGGNKWLYPDLVGVKDLSHDWHREIKDCVKECSDRRAELWSFEVKIKINRSNVREVFFKL